MKNATMNTIYSVLTSVDFADKDAIMTELYNELHRNDAAKSEKAALYAKAHDVVFETLRMASAPLAVSEIFEECAERLPDGFTKNQIAYGLRAYWADEVVKTEGKVNLYSVKE